MIRIGLLIVAALGSTVPTAGAVYYYENTQYRYSAQQPTYPSSYPSSSNRVCLYRNTSGECMVEQFIDTSNYNTGRSYYTPTYDREYLYNERRYSNRDDDDEYDYYYDDDDDYYYDDDDDYYNDIDDDEWEDIKDDFFDDDDDSDDDDDD